MELSVVIVVGEQKSKLNRILEKLNYLKPLEIIIVADNRMNTIQSITTIVESNVVVIEEKTNVKHQLMGQE